TVQQWQRWAPSVLPLPHPSPRNTLWLKNHPWFEQDIVPYLRQRVKQVLT
ncbi:TPA: uracil-DNA glycosylase family protein, partial [Vibrio cholerae]